MTRVFKLKTGQSKALVSVETDVKTFGEFKALPEVKELKINWKSVKVLKKSDKNSLEADSALLPDTGDFFFIVPTKNKSGLTDSEIDDLSYTEVKKAIMAIPDLKINFVGKTATALREELKKYNASLPKSDAPVMPTQVKIYVEGIDPSQIKIISADELATSSKEELTKEEMLIRLDLADYITNEEIEEDYKSLSSELS